MLVPVCLHICGFSICNCRRAYPLCLLRHVDSVSLLFLPKVAVAVAVAVVVPWCLNLIWQTFDYVNRWVKFKVLLPCICYNQRLCHFIGTISLAKQKVLCHEYKSVLGVSDSIHRGTFSGRFGNCCWWAICINSSTLHFAYQLVHWPIRYVHMRARRQAVMKGNHSGRKIIAYLNASLWKSWLAVSPIDLSSSS